MRSSTICRRWAIKLFQATTVAVFWAAVWYFAYRMVGRDLLLVSPKQTVLRLFALCGTKLFWRSIAWTGGRVLGGFLAALLIGTALAALCARFRVVNHLLQPLMSTIWSTPVASFIILALVWIATDGVPIFIAFLTVIPVVWLNIRTGIAEVDRDLLEMALLFRMPKLRILRAIYLPGVMPYFLTACSSGLGFAWKSALAAEVISRPSVAVGREINNAKVYLETADLFAWTMAVVLLSVLLEKTAVALLRKLAGKITRAGPAERGGEVQ